MTFPKHLGTEVIKTLTFPFCNHILDHAHFHVFNWVLQKLNPNMKPLYVAF